MPYEGIRSTSLLTSPCHVSQVYDTHTLDGPGLAPTPLGAAVGLDAFAVRVSYMALLPTPPPPADLADTQVVASHEFGDADYIREVLGRPATAAETDIEQELVAKAAALGIELPISATRFTAIEPSSPTAVSSDALDLQHGRTVSTGSNETAVCRVESNASHQSTVMPATLTESPGRRRSRSLSFSQYEKYLSQVDPALDQPKFLRSKGDKTAGVVIKSTSRKGVKGFTRSLANRLRRKRPAPAANTPM